MGAYLPLPGLEPIGGEPLMSVTCEGGLLCLREADEAAVDWLTTYGS